MTPIFPGSSPLSRGIRPRCRAENDDHGIIPALAGNTRHSNNPYGEPGDHPRSRGEYQALRILDSLPEGSSPLSRGIPPTAPLGATGGGIIPALAGNTHGARPDSEPPEDHPRSRGEYEQSVRRTRFGQGSSPLSRGILTLKQPFENLSRIIPALAGNTMPPPVSSSPAQDHPRSRGEYAC